MAYTEEKFFTRGTHFDNAWRISILQNAGPGAAERITANNYMFKRRWPFSEDRDFWKQKIIEPVLEVSILFDRSTDLSFYRGIVNAPDDTYRLEFKYGGALNLFGSIRGDLVEITEHQGQAKVVLRAKPLALQRGRKYTLHGSDTFKEIAPFIGELVNLTGTDLPVYTYNRWASPNGGGRDYFRDVAVNAYHLRKYAGTRDTDTAITYEQALKDIIPDGYVFTLAEGAWHLVSVAYIAEQAGNNVERFKYVFGGTVYAFDSSDIIDMRKPLGQARGENTIKTQDSKTKHFSAYKRINQTFNNKTLITNIEFDASYLHNSITESPAVIEQAIETDGQQHVILEGSVRVDTDDTGGNFKTGDAFILLQAVDAEYDDDNDTWPISGDEINISLSGSGEELTANFSFKTISIPSGKEGTLRLELRWATDDGLNFAWSADEVEWNLTNYQIVNDMVPAPGAGIEYELEQSQEYAAALDLPKRIFGDKPTIYSKSALSFLDTNYVPVNGFGRKGEALIPYAELLMGDIMNAQRNGTDVLKAELWSEYGVIDVITYDGNQYLVIGGDFSGYASMFSATLYKLDFNAASDTLSVVEDFGGAAIGGTPPSGDKSGIQQLNDLSDVTINNPATDEGLFYDGANFVNRTLAAGDIPNLDAAKITTGQFADGRISESSVTQWLGTYTQRNVAESVSASWTFSDDLNVVKGSGTAIKARVALNIAGAGGMDTEAVDTGNFNFIPVVGGSQQTGVTLRYNHASLRWEINGSEILTGAAANQDLGWSPSTNTVTITDGTNAQISTFGQNITHEGRVDFKGSLEQFRVYNGSGGTDFFHYEFDGTTYKLRRTDASVPDTIDVISIDFATGKVNLSVAGAEVAGADIATEPWANGRFAITDSTQTISGAWDFTTRPTINSSNVVDVSGATFTGNISAVAGTFTGLIGAEGGNTITSNPPFVANNVGWKVGLYGTSYAVGIAPSTLAVKTNNWLSVFEGDNPAGDASGSVPDTRATVSLGNGGEGVFSGLLTAEAGINISSGNLQIGGTEVIDSFRNLSAVAGTFTGDLNIGTNNVIIDPQGGNLRFSYSGAVDNRAMIQVMDSGGASIGRLDFQDTNRFRFTTDIEANNFHGTSDRRVKSKAKPITGALESLRNITPHTFLKNGSPDAGYFADQVMKHTRNVVHLSEHDEYKDFKSMGVFGMQAYNTAAIRELDAECQRLRGEVDKLKRQLKDRAA